MSKKRFSEVYSDKSDRKKRGVFYTPDRYVSVSTEYVRQAIKDTKAEGYDDYVIIDRCCGTGNLESQLTPEELSHCILGTLDPEEAKIASERLGIPVHCGDALSREGVLYYRNEIEKRAKND